MEMGTRRDAVLESLALNISLMPFPCAPTTTAISRQEMSRNGNSEDVQFKTPLTMIL